MTKIFRGILLFLAAVSTAHGQSARSPYSILGIGDLHESTSVNIEGMAGIGYSYGNTFFFNPKNPAHLALNKMTVFDIGFFWEAKYLKQGAKAGLDAGGNITSLNLALPIHKKATLAIGVKPLSSVNYNFSFEKKIPDRPSYASYNYKGSGGVNQAYMALGGNLYKGFSLGMTVGYNFGLIDSESRVLLNDPLQGGNGTQTEYLIDLFERDAYSKITFQAGAAWKIKLSDNKYLNFGTVFNPASDFNVKSTRTIERRTLNDITIQSDTLALRNKTNSLPSTLGTGMSYQILNKLVAGIDYSFSDWSKSVSEGGTGLSRPAQSYKLSGGLEFTPNLYSVSSFFKRMTYRVGGFYEQLPVITNGKPSLNVGINFGGSLPVGRNLSSLNYAFTFGRKGAFESNSIREDYARFHLGLTINERWFMRRKIN